MRREHRRFLIVDEIVVTAIVNFAINAGIAWFFFHAATTVPLFGRASITADTLGTAFVLPLLTALIATPLVRLQVARGKLPRLNAGSAWSRRSTVVRGVAVGVAAVFVVAAPVVGVFALVGPAALATGRFIVFKASFAAALGALVTPLLGWWALQDASSSS